MEVILNVNDLEYQEIFKKVSLSVEKAKITVVAGGNNSGKTTLVKILDRKIVDQFNINFLGKDIKDYLLEEYYSLVQFIYPGQYIIQENTPYEELKRNNVKEERLDFIHKKLKRLLEKQTSKLTEEEVLWTEILVGLGRAKELVVIDGMDQVFSKEELEEAYTFLKKYAAKFELAILLTTSSLEGIINSDFIYILKDGEVILKGDPLTVLQKDNILNKAALNLPFMIDLSVKLRDYDLIQTIELDKETLINKLWN